MMQQRISRKAMGIGGLMLAMFMLAAAVAGEALTPSPEMQWFTVDAGGGVMAGNGFVLTGTVGQMDAAPPMVGVSGGGDNIAFSAGFWQGVAPFTECPADVSPLGGNGVVDIDDLLLVIAAWGTNNPQFDIVSPGVPGATPVIDMDDLLAVIAAWGMCPE
jgi:hypothetical protein